VYSEEYEKKLAGHEDEEKLQRELERMSTSL
jgi:hypothetical protein